MISTLGIGAIPPANLIGSLSAAMRYAIVWARAFVAGMRGDSAQGEGGGTVECEARTALASGHPRAAAPWYSHGVVRAALSRTAVPAAQRMAEIALPDANRALSALGVRAGHLHGHKFAAAVGASASGRWLAVAACAQPCEGALRDGLTAQVCCLAVDASMRDRAHELLDAVELIAASHGYRRLVIAPRNRFVERLVADSGWAPMWATPGRGARPRLRAVWQRVISGESRRSGRVGDQPCERLTSIP